MIRAEKLFTLFEQSMQKDGTGKVAGVAGYRDTLRTMLGIVEQDGADARVDPKNREFDAREVSLGDLWNTFKPRRWGHSDMKEALQKVQPMQMAEAEGFVVMPSHFANISAFSSTVAGLLDAMIMEGYDSPRFVGDQFFSPDDTKMDGGKMIGIMNDGNAGEDLAIGEPYPTVGLKETFVTIPSNKRRGNTIQVNELDFVFDRTGKIQKGCEDAGIAVRYNREIDQAKVFMGIVNNYSRDGNASNTYLKTAGFVPNNYVNSVGTLPMTGFAAIDTANRTFNGNRDPGTNFEITMPRPVKIAVFDLREMNARTILFATEVERRTVDQTVISRAENPLYPAELIVLPRMWLNLLVASGVTLVNATDRWYAGDWKKAFRYRTIFPFETREAPLSSEDVRRDIVLIRVAREMGASWVAEPRYAFQATNEA